MNKIRVIDLLNKIANGDIPKKILYDYKVWEYCAGDYYSGEYSLLNDYLELTDLNNEAKIVEGKKIEKLEYDEHIVNDLLIADLYTKINEIIDKLNEMGDK